MKKTYSTPEIQILFINSEAVITSSGDTDNGVQLPFDKFD